jgi:hypothetical protein
MALAHDNSEKMKGQLLLGLYYKTFYGRFNVALSLS